MNWWTPSGNSLPENENEVTPGFELAAARRDEIVERLARRVVQRGMETPAVFLLEMSKPVSFLVSQAVVTAGPLLYPFFGFERIDALSGFLNSRDNVERLIRRIEELSQGGSSSRETGDREGR